MADLADPRSTPAATPAAATPATPATAEARGHDGALLASPSAKLERRVRGMAFVFPWSSEPAAGRGETDRDGLSEQLAAGGG